MRVSRLILLFQVDKETECLPSDVSTAATVAGRASIKGTRNPLAIAKNHVIGSSTEPHGEEVLLNCLRELFEKFEDLNKSDFVRESK